MKPKRTADLSLFLTVTGLLLASLAFVYARGTILKAPIKTEPQSRGDSAWFRGGDRHQFWQIYKNPDSIMPLNLAIDSTGEAGRYDRYEGAIQGVMDSIYKVILKKYRHHTDVLHNIKTAQASWLKYREAELKAIIDPSLYGSWEAVNQCHSEYWVALMRQRIGELMMWLKLPKETEAGQNVCNTYGLYLRNEDTIVFTK